MPTKRYDHERMSEAFNELGPTAVNVFTGKSVFTREFLVSRGVVNPIVRRPVNTVRRATAATTLNQISTNETVTFPYDGVQYTGTVKKINTTTARVLITKIDGTPRNRITVGMEIRVGAGILAYNENVTQRRHV